MHSNMLVKQCTHGAIIAIHGVRRATENVSSLRAIQQIIAPTDTGITSNFSWSCLVISLARFPTIVRQRNDDFNEKIVPECVKKTLPSNCPYPPSGIAGCQGSGSRKSSFVRVSTSLLILLPTRLVVIIMPYFSAQTHVVPQEEATCSNHLRSFRFPNVNLQYLLRQNFPFIPSDALNCRGGRSQI